MASAVCRGFLGEWICGLLSSRWTKFEIVQLEELPRGLAMQTPTLQSKRGRAQSVLEPRSSPDGDCSGGGGGCVLC